MTDIRYAIRMLLKSPGFTVIAIITLALGIGTSTAIFSVLEAVLLRPLPFPHQERIVEVRELAENGRGMRFTEPNFFDLKGQSRSFEALTEAFFARERASAVLLIDARHPGLESDRAAWQWLHRAAPAAIVGTKIDKLTRSERTRALRQLESVFEDTVLPVSAVTGEGLDELWKLIDRLANSRQP